MKDYKQIHIRIPDERIYREFMAMVALKYGATYTYTGIELSNALQLWIEKNHHLIESSSQNPTHTHINQGKEYRIKKIKEWLEGYEFPDIPTRVLTKFIRKTDVSDSRVVKDYMATLVARDFISLKTRSTYENLLFKEKKEESNEIKKNGEKREERREKKESEEEEVRKQEASIIKMNGGTPLFNNCPGCGEPCRDAGAFSRHIAKCADYFASPKGKGLYVELREKDFVEGQEVN